jgi:DNA-binding NtrC family response regulator
MPVIKLNAEAEQALINYYWHGNVRQLKNIAEQISIIEKNREINSETLVKYLPVHQGSVLPSLIKADGGTTTEMSERDLLYKVLFDMKKDLNDLKKVVHDIIQFNQGNLAPLSNEDSQLINRIYEDSVLGIPTPSKVAIHPTINASVAKPIVIEESLSLADKEKDMIIKALIKYKGKRKFAAKELGISERTLYRKINEYNIKD